MPSATCDLPHTQVSRSSQQLLTGVSGIFSNNFCCRGPAQLGVLRLTAPAHHKCWSASCGRRHSLQRSALFPRHQNLSRCHPVHYLPPSLP